ncbi:MAG TPA: GIY-YIG nuclease family protein [Bacteroidia bacterium]|nr:GIY-YIG nuclease family protein [Bacteroidia bacterium]
MRKYSVYILKCADDSYYTGVTNNLRRRLREHVNASNEGSYTSERLPVELVWSENFRDVRVAIRREKQIKRWSRVKKEALIEGRVDDLKMLAKKKFVKKKVV